MLRSVFKLSSELVTYYMKQNITLILSDLFLVRDGNIYSCTFYKEINNNCLFHTLHDYRNDLLYWPLHSELFSFFFYWRKVLFFLFWAVFSIKTLSGKFMFNPLESIVLTKTRISVYFTHPSLIKQDMTQGTF